jgi:hypothetical protein
MPTLMSRLSRVSRSTWLVLGTYLFFSLFAAWGTWIHGPTTYLPSGVGGDGGQFIWFLKWIPYAIVHGLNPNQSMYLNMPHGVTLASLTSMPLLGLLMAPVTLTLGPALSYNVLAALAIFGSATSAYFVAKRWVVWKPARYLAGLIFGFSPYVVGQNTGHIFLTTGVAFPILLLCFDELFNRQQWSKKKLAAILAVALVFEIGVSIELLADVAVVLGITVVGIALVKRKEALAKLPYIRSVLPWLALYAGPFVIGFCLLYLQGAGLGAAREPRAVANLSADLATFILPGANQLFHWGVHTSGDRYVNFTLGGKDFPDFVENGAYVGLPLLLLLGISIKLLWDKRFVRYFVSALGVSVIIALGAYLRIGGHKTPLILPFFFMSRQKAVFFNSMIAIRYMDFAFLIIGLLVAAGLDEMRKRYGLRSKQFGLAGVAVVLTVLTLLPPWPINGSKIALPAWFNAHNLSHVPVRSTLLTFPMAHDSTGWPMMWQALSDFKFNIPGAEAGGQAINSAPLLLDLNACQSLVPGAKVAFPPTYAADRADMKSWHVRTIVAPGSPLSPQQIGCAVSLFTRITGKPPIKQDHAFVWLNLPY